MLDRKEKLCRAALLILLIFSIIESIRVIWQYDPVKTVHVFDTLLLLLLFITLFQGIVGIIGWIMLVRDNEKGKGVLIKTYVVSFGLYGLYSLFLLISSCFPNTFVVDPFELISIFSLCFLSGAVLVLQHFWTRYIF